MLVVTHDRWFLDAVCTHTWEVADGDVHQYEGGYAAYVLARAERERQAAAREERRQQLLRKELAWLRRGPAGADVQAEVPDRGRQRADRRRARGRATAPSCCASPAARLGDKVLDAERRLGRLRRRSALLRDATWRLGPGDRVALVGVNGSGKTTLMKLLAGELAPDAGEVERGATVRARAPLPGHGRDPRPPARARVGRGGRGRAALGDGRELTAGMLCERFGFRGEKAPHARAATSRGGERRRLQLMRLLMGEPNVLLLDEPTNDLDIDTLTALEDLLDGWPGTLVVVSHDRYFVERVCDNVYALTGDGAIRHLPGRDRAVPRAAPRRGGRGTAAAAAGRAPGAPAGAVVRAARKEVARLERALEKLGDARGGAARRDGRRARPTTCGCASCRPSSTRSAPSARLPRPPGSRRPRPRRADR